MSCNPRKSPAATDTAPLVLHDCELPAITQESDVVLSDGLFPQRNVKASLEAPGAVSTVTVRESTVQPTGINVFAPGVSVAVREPDITLKN